MERDETWEEVFFSRGGATLKNNFVGHRPGDALSAR